MPPFHLLKLSLFLGATVALLTACGPTGNRLNVGVISDPRTQFDPNNTSGNEGTVVPTNPGTNDNILDPSVGTPSGGSSASSNTNTQNSGNPGAVFFQALTPPLTRASSPNWTIEIGADGVFVLAHRSEPYGTFDLQLAGTETPQPDGTRRFTITDRQGSGLPDVMTGIAVDGVEWTDRLIVLDGDRLDARGMIALSEGATCPTADINGIWLDAGASVAAGTLSYSTSTGIANQSVAINPVTGQNHAGRSYRNGTCGTSQVLGLVSTAPTAYGNAYIALSAAGVGVLSDDTTRGLSLPVPSPTSLAGLSGDYIGMLGPRGNIGNAAMSCDDLGHCVGSGSFSIRIDALNTVANGISTGQFTDSAGLPHPIACISGTDLGLDGRVELLSCHVDAATPEDLVFVRVNP